MNYTIRAITVGLLLTIAALVLSACGTVPSAPIYPPSGMPGTEPGRGMGGGGMMRGGMMGQGGMMDGNSYSPDAPAILPTPIDATPVSVDQEIPITASDYRFKPDQITVRPGEAVGLVVTNKDGTPHNLISRDAGIPYFELPGRTTQTLTWTAPIQAGTYTAVCTLHPGMSLSIVVPN